MTGQNRDILKENRNKNILQENNKFKILKELNLNKNFENQESIDENDMIGNLIQNNPHLIEGDLNPLKGSNYETYTPINKGHFDLDTIERKNEFERKLSEGWESDYADYRNLWIKLGKDRVTRDYPLLVDLELSSRCNLHCPMCYTTTEHYLKTVNLKYMDFDVFKKIIDEIAGKVFAIRLSLRGESTLHKQFIDAVRYAKSKGIFEVSSLTHGKKLSGQYLKDLVEAGIDWITVSVDGMGEDYNAIRHPLTWEGTLGRLKEIKELKKSLGINKPVIKIQGIWPSIKPYPTQFYEDLMPYTDLIAYNPLIDYLDNDEDIEYEDNFSCPQLYQRLVVGSDNKVMMCANDERGDGIVGNAKFQTIHEIWHGKRMKAIRKLHSIHDGFKKLHTCKVCYYPRKTEGSEKAAVGSREITIENYTNRSQTVGK
tara:strand:- start:182 stop:1462 length:1281 start_codon:yes stop_codon:yes gene_type:complete